MSNNFDFVGMLPLVLVFVVMYFLIIHPQNKKAKKHQEMLGALKKGDKVITNGGLIGKVVKTLDTEIVLEIASGVEVHVSRPMIATILNTSVETPKKEEPTKFAKEVKKAPVKVAKKTVKK